MIATSLFSLHARRWIVLLGITVVVQWVSVALASQFVCACPGPYIHVLLVTAVPVLWSLALLTVYRGATERFIAYGAFALSAAILLVIHRWTLGI